MTRGANRYTLIAALPEATEARARQTIQDALAQADEPKRRPLAEYPLNQRERRAIRGGRPRL